MARETREAWARRVRRWQKSGLSASEFAGREGVNASTLSYWKWKLGREGALEGRGARPAKPAGASFVEVIPMDASAEVSSPGEVILERVRIRCDGATARDLIAALGGLR